MGCVRQVSQICRKCKEEVEGEDLGDHPGYLEYYCECGNSWGDDKEGMDRLVDYADFLRKAEKEGR